MSFYRTSSKDGPLDCSFTTLISSQTYLREKWDLALQIEYNSLFPCSAQELTITLQSLPCKAPEQRATVITKRWALVVVDFEAVRHVNLEPLLVELQQKSHVGESLLFTSVLHEKPTVLKFVPQNVKNLLPLYSWLGNLIPGFDLSNQTAVCTSATHPDAPNTQWKNKSTSQNDSSWNRCLHLFLLITLWKSLFFFFFYVESQSRWQS